MLHCATEATTIKTVTLLNRTFDIMAASHYTKTTQTRKTR